jgi:peptidylprolyl isomerase
MAVRTDGEPVVGSVPRTSGGLMTRTATVGDTVHVHYTGRLDNGEVFDSSQGRDPLSFALGEGQVIPGFDHAVTGLEVGSTVTVRLDADDAYGHPQAEMVLTVPADQAPPGLSTGDDVLLGDHPARVVEIDEEQVVVDANHPLAGEALTFDIELVGID